MKVRYANGEVSSIRNDLGRELVRAGIAEAIGPEDDNDLPKPPATGLPTVPEPKWEILIKQINSTGRRELVIRMTRPGFVSDYFGEPKHANAYRSWPGPDGKKEGGRRWLNGFGVEIPAEVLTEYTRQWKRNPHLRGEAVPGVAVANTHSVSGTAMCPPDRNRSNKSMAEELKAKNVELHANAAALNNQEVVAMADDDTPLRVSVVIE